MNSTTANPKPVFVGILASICRTDPLFVPALAAAVLGTGYTVFAPPAWVTRVPTALVDIATGDRLRLSQAVDETARERNELSSALSQTKSDLAKTEEALQTAESRLEQRRAAVGEITQIRDAHADSLAQLAERNEQIDELASRLAHVQRSNAELAARAGAQNDAIEVEALRVREMLRSAEGRIDEQKRSISSLREALVDRQASLEAIEKERSLLSTQITAERKEYDSLRKTVAALRLSEREFESLGARLAQSANIEKNLRGELVTVRMQLEEAKTQLSEAGASLKTRTEFLFETETKAAQLADALDAARLELEALKQQYASLETGNEVQSEQLEGDIEALTQELELVRHSEITAVRELAAVQEELAKSTAKVDQESLREAQTRSELLTTQNELTRQEDMVSELELKTKVLSAEILRLLGVLGVAAQTSAGLKARTTDQQEDGDKIEIQRLRDLAKFRSEFFRRLSLLLSDRREVRVVGDRFVFQAEVLFESGSAALGPNGRMQLAQVADTLRALVDETPPGVQWILRVDGHTDSVPIQTSEFPSNWELSAARAISVVRFLVAEGVPSMHLSANGFGANQPLDDTGSKEAYSRNRRIELKLTER